MGLLPTNGDEDACGAGAYACQPSMHQELAGDSALPHTGAASSTERLPDTLVTECYSQLKYDKVVLSLITIPLASINGLA